MLEVKGLSLADGSGRPILCNIGLFVRERECVGLTGASGAGKSLIAQTIAGLAGWNGLRILGGQVRFRGIDLLSAPPNVERAIRGREIAYIPQQPLSALNPVLSAGHQLSLLLRRHTSLSGPERRVRIHQTLAKLGFKDTSQLLVARPTQLSGGERQRVLLASSIILRPSLIVADEPTASLDRINQLRFLELLDEMRREWQFSLLVITHDPHLVSSMSDRTYEFVGKELRLRTHRNPPRPILAQASSPVKNRAPILQAVGVEKRFGRTKVLGKLNFSAYAGECVGIVGESGAGKTLLARCLTGLISVDNGRIIDRSSGVPMRIMAPNPRIQMVFQDPVGSFDPRLTLQQSLEEALLIYGVHRSEWTGEINELCRTVRLDPEILERFPTSVSGGECQRAAIARALAMRPQVLIGDEPTSALDEMTGNGILDLFRQLAWGRHIAIVLITHDFRSVIRVCSRISIMTGGRIAESGAVGEILRSPKTDFARELVRSI